MKTFLTLSLCAWLLVGCATVATRVDRLTPEQVAAFEETKLSDLCRDYYQMRKGVPLRYPDRMAAVRFGPEAVKQLEEVLLKLGLTEEELDSSRDGKIFIGMSQAGMYAALGLPFNANRTVTRGGAHVQHVYGYDAYSRFYVYTENGVVTSWQD